MSNSPPAVEEPEATAVPDGRPPNGLHEAPIRPELVAPLVTRGQVISFRAGAMAGELAARRRDPEEPAARIAARCLTDHFALMREVLAGLRLSHDDAVAVYCLAREPRPREELRRTIARYLSRPPAVAWAVLDACERLGALDDQLPSLWHERAVQVGLLKLPKPRPRRRAKGAQS